MLVEESNKKKRRHYCAERNSFIRFEHCDTQFTWYVRLKKVALKGGSKKMMKKMSAHWRGVKSSSKVHRGRLSTGRVAVFFHGTGRHSRRRIGVQLIIPAETRAVLVEVFRYPESFFLRVEFPRESFCTEAALSFSYYSRASNGGLSRRRGESFADFFFRSSYRVQSHF